MSSKLCARGVHKFEARYDTYVGERGVVQAYHKRQVIGPSCPPNTRIIYVQDVCVRCGEVRDRLGGPYA